MNKNKNLVNSVIERLITDRNTRALDEYFSPEFVQHSTRIAAGPEGLLAFVRSLSETSSYEAARTLA